MDSLTSFLMSAWTLAIVPSCVAIVAIYSFAKLLRENKKLELEIARLQLEQESKQARIHAPSDRDIQTYGRHPSPDIKPLGCPQESSTLRMPTLRIWLRWVAVMTLVAAAIVAKECP